MDWLFSTQGVMILLLGAYAVAMWMFLTSAPKIHTVMVSDMDQARAFYEGQLELPIAQIPLSYYYGYETSLSAGDSLYLPMEGRQSRKDKYDGRDAGLWYQLQKNVQIHIVSGAHSVEPNRNRHLCFNRDCVEQVLLRIQMLGMKHKVRNEKPLSFLVKDLDGRVIEIAEVSTAA